MIEWAKAPSIGQTKFEWYQGLQDLILETTASHGTNIVCKCSSDVAPIIVFFNGLVKSPTAEIYGEYEFGKAFGITYIITPYLTRQIDIEVDDKVFESIKIM